MKVAPNSNFPVHLRAEDGWEVPEAVRHLFRGIFGIGLNFSESLYLVPQFDIGDLEYSVINRPFETLTTASQARAIWAAKNYVVSPSEDQQGRDLAIPIANMPSGELRSSSRNHFKMTHSIVLYVSPEEYATLSAEVAELVSEGSQSFEAGNVSLAGQLVRRFGVPVEELQHLAIGRFLKGRFIKSQLVEAPMLGKPATSSN